MNKKLSLLAAGAFAGLTILISALNAQTAGNTTAGNTTTAPAASGNMTAAPASTGNATATGNMTAPAAKAAPAGATATSGNMTASSVTKPGPKVDLTKLPKPSDKTGLTFDKDIEPILKASCSGCHIGGTRMSGGLDLGTLATALKGGTKGKDKDIVPNQADQSNVVLYTSGALPTAMPPMSGRTGNPPPHPALTPDQIGLIMAWINQGAK